MLMSACVAAFSDTFTEVTGHQHWVYTCKEVNLKLPFGASVDTAQTPKLSWWQFARHLFCVSELDVVQQ